MSSDVVTLVVGGVSYTIQRRNIDRHPDSLLAAVVKTEWYHRKKPIRIDRDGGLFKHICAYIVSGSLPMNSNPAHSPTLLDNIRKEAEHFGLPELAKDCVPNKVFMPSKIIRDLTNNARQQGGMTVDYPNFFTTPLLRALGSLWAQFFVHGAVRPDPSYSYTDKIYLSSTMSNPNVPELVQAASTTSRPAQEQLGIPADDLSLTGLDHLEQSVNQAAQKLFPNTPIKMRPSKLVLFQEGGPYDLQHETDGRAGTAVVALNTECTGGELEITHGGSTEVVSGSNSWVAMYVHSKCKIKHIASGTRVALIYGLYCVSDPLPEDKRACLYEAQYEDDSDDECECEEEEGECDVDCDEDNEDEDEDADEDEGECVDQPAAKRTKADVERGTEGGGREVYSRGNYDVIWHHMGDDEYVPPLDRRILRGADAEAIYTALNQELAHHDSVVICLQHMYPACLAVPGFLKPTDADLHSLLREHYSLQVVYCFVYCKEICNVYTRDSGQVRAMIWPDSETATATAIKPTKLVIPATLYPDSVLDYTLNLTAHQRERVDTAFVITGLRVSAKV
jgi:hypothetical protein